MTNRQDLMQYLTLIPVCICILLLVFSPMALASSIEPDIYDQWNRIEEFEQTTALKNLLIENDWINENVSVEELDYILVLTQQCSEEFFPNLSTALVLGVISVESGFKSDLVGYSNDTGLMQVIPKWHQDRIERYSYDENVNLYDPRLNVMVGMDYLDELLTWSEGDLYKTLMAYNMGQSNARRYHDAGRVTQYSIMVIERMNAIQDILERRR